MLALSRWNIFLQTLVSLIQAVLCLRFESLDEYVTHGQHFHFLGYQFRQGL